MTSEIKTEQIDPKPFRFTKKQYRRMMGLGWLTSNKAELRDGAILEQDSNRSCFEQTLRCFSRDEYYQILDFGWFEGHRVELIDGEILEVPARSNRLAIAISTSAEALELVFGAGYWVRKHGSLDLRPRSTPDPDLAVVAGDVRTHSGEANPTTALLIVEVSEETLGFDRGRKGSLYAACGIADYWIVNVVDQQLEVYRNPVADATKRFGFRYADRTDLSAGAFISPLAAPTAKIAVADLLP
jgi:Uma2 family endonuclease